jgi:hypothetical protein
VSRPNFSGDFAKRFCACGFGLVDALPLVFGQPGYDEAGVDGLALENFRSTLGHILCQGRLDDGRALKTEAFAISDCAIHQGTVEELPGAADKVPTQPVLPTSIVQIAEKALDIARILHENVVVNTPAAGDLGSGVGAIQARTCAGAGYARCPLETRRNSQERVPHTPRRFDARKDGGRHPLSVEIDQRPGRLPRAIVYELPRSRYRTRVVLQLCRNGNLGCIREIGP